MTGAHCDFCQKHTGSAFRVSSFFGEDQISENTGDPNVYKGLEIIEDVAGRQARNSSN